MTKSLYDIFSSHRKASPEGVIFLRELESSASEDLWKSAGGHWSESSIEKIRLTAMKRLAEELLGDSASDYQQSWALVVRDFHTSFWDECRLQKKEKKKQTEEQKIFWELFSYIWMLLQAALVTKTAVFYFGIKSTEDRGTEGKVYVVLAILFSFASLMFFAYRKSKKNKDKEL